MRQKDARIMMKNSALSPAAPALSVKSYTDLESLWRQVTAQEPGDIYVR